MRPLPPEQPTRLKLAYKIPPPGQGGLPLGCFRMLTSGAGWEGTVSEHPRHGHSGAAFHGVSCRWSMVAGVNAVLNGER